MSYPKSKIEIINTLILELKDDPDNPWKDRSPDKLVFEWFLTGRAGQGLRLTDIGAKAFEYAKIAHYDFNIEKDNLAGATWEKYAMTLNKKVNCPYHVGVKLDEKKKKQPYIRIYDHKIAMLMTLYGSVNKYLESVK